MHRSMRAPLLLALACSVPLSVAGCSVDAGGDSSSAPPGSDAAVAMPSPDAAPPDPGAPDASPAMDAGGKDAAHEAGADAAGTADAADASDPTALPGWTLTWHDEFNLADGSPVDPGKWTQETGNAGWGNNHERQYYTAGTANAVIRGGSLLITATSQGASQYQCQYGTCQYTSARMNTAGKFEQAYGRFESRIKLTIGKGVWPAFWVLGNNISTVSWPQCGEIDIMENIGSTPSTNYGSLHGPGYSGGQDLTGSYTLPGHTLSEDFHVYAIEWEPNVVRFYFDGVNYETRTPADVPAGKTWVYDHPFFVILNLAIGGYWPGDPDATTQLPQTLTVDYVRVYAKK
jgi:beta-glucanase (GH16 family)